MTQSDALRSKVLPFAARQPDWQPIMRALGDARLVLLGESTHGTHEFYALRASLTKQLIAEHGFAALVIEGDWPDAQQVDRYLAGAPDSQTADQALAGFARFPTWMWRNHVVRDLVGWLHEHNANAAQRASFHGLDLYSLHTSMHHVLAHLAAVDPEAARIARERYSCFDSFGGDPQRYGYTTARGFLPSCEDEVVAQLVALHETRARASAQGLDAADEDALFVAEQNARVVKNAEQYYRSMYRGGVSSWNLRDTHMADTIDALSEHLRRSKRADKLIVWAHNSHLGDARATELAEQGELNLGQLLRERHPGQTFSLGFSTYHGQVTAASEWDQPPQRKRVRPGLRGSYEALFHQLERESFWLDLREPRLAALLDEPRLQRAIGVLYRPDTERRSHYFHARLARQFDALIHVDKTTALEPLTGHGKVEATDELPETYPSGL